MGKHKDGDKFIGLWLDPDHQRMMEQVVAHLFKTNMTDAMLRMIEHAFANPGAFAAKVANQQGRQKIGYSKEQSAR